MTDAEREARHDYYAWRDEHRADERPDPIEYRDLDEDQR